MMSDFTQSTRTRRSTGSHLSDARARDVIGGALRPNDPRRFLVEAMVGAMNADGHVDPRELEVLRRHLDQHELFAGVAEASAHTMVDLATDAVKFAGSAIGRVPAIARGLPSRIHRLTAYALAMEIVAADDEYTVEEGQFLEALRLALRVTPPEATTLYQAMREARLGPCLDGFVARVRDLIPIAIDLFTLRARARGVATAEHMLALCELFRALPDLCPPESVMSLELELTRAFAAPRRPDHSVVAELAAIAARLPDRLDRWWLALYCLVAEPAGTARAWRQQPFLGLLQQAFELRDDYLDTAALDAEQFPGWLPRPR